MYKRFDINVGDYVKFKSVRVENEKKQFNVYYGKIFDISARTNYVGIKIDPTDKRLDFPVGLTIYIERKQLLQVYSHKIVEHLTPRLALKNLWSDLIFREVKTTKCNDLLYAEYRYIGKNGFEKIKRYKTLEEAYLYVLPEYHKNIVACYDEYFGFTTDKALRNNDVHYDREIFFSKKSYTELDWTANATGDFLFNERGYNCENPQPDSIICGVVENGEKGLFFRKWFLCSREFLTLWTMICEPSDSSLYELNNTFSSEWKQIDRKKKIKDFDKLLEELDTSFYSVDLKLELDERKKKYLTHNIERVALFFNNRYRQVAEIVFSKGYINKDNSKSYSYTFSEDYRSKYSSFQKHLVRNILWPKRLNSAFSLLSIVSNPIHPPITSTN